MYLKRTIKILVFIVTLFVLMGTVTCRPPWVQTNSDFDKFSTCDPYKDGPQMLKLPVLENAWVTVSHCYFPSTKDITYAIIVFEDEWTKAFGKSVALNIALNNLFVEISEADKSVTGYTVTGTKYVNAPIIGLTRTPRWIWVYSKPGKFLCQTSLVHELVHVAIWSHKVTDGDPDHEGDKYSGWTDKHTAFIASVNETLCAMSL